MARQFHCAFSSSCTILSILFVLFLGCEVTLCTLGTRCVGNPVTGSAYCDPTCDDPGYFWCGDEQRCVLVDGDCPPDQSGPCPHTVQCIDVEPGQFSVTCSAYHLILKLSSLFPRPYTQYFNVTRPFAVCNIEKLDIGPGTRYFFMFHKYYKSVVSFVHPQIPVPWWTVDQATPVGSILSVETQSVCLQCVLY